MMKRFVMAVCAGIMLTSGVVLAQPAPDAAPAARPDVKAIGDWFVRCFPIQSPNPCDMFQELDSPTTHERVISLSLAYVPSIDRHAIQITVPLDIAIQKGLTIKTDSFTSPVLKYRNCDRNGCYVLTPVDNSLVEALSKADGSKGKVNIVADAGKTYALDFFLKGFTAAHDDMVAKARAKAKPVAKSGDAAPAPGATP